MINLRIDEEYVGLVDKSAVLKASNASLLHKSINTDDIEITIVFEGDSKLQDLNNRFRKIDAPTDVLSFPSKEIDPDTGRRYLGDVVISVARAQAQADTENHSIGIEIQLLVVHGILHLLGYDHHREEDKLVMWESKRTILSELGLAIDIPD